jgi:hypothetical protein
MLNLVFDKWGVYGPIANCMPDNIVNYILFEYEQNEDEWDGMSFALNKKFGLEFSIWNNLFGIELNKDLIKSIPYNKNLKNWIYAIEPWGHLSYSCNLFADIRGGEYRNFFKNIPTEIKKSINSGDGKLVINYSHEGWVNDWLLKNLYLGIKNTGISTKNAVLILNDYNLENKINKFIENNNIDVDNFPTIINYNFYVAFSSFYFFNKYRNTDIDVNKYFENKTQKFLFLNRRMETHKAKILGELYNNIKNDSIISFDKKIISADVLFENENNLELKTKFDSIPEKSIADIENLEEINGYKHENSFLYEKTLFSIVTETNFYNENDFISEKIFKPLWHLQPFIVAGRPYMLKYLKNLGFKTFDWLIDESYDNVEDNNERMKLIINEVNNLNKIPINELHTKIYNNIDILLHNRNVINEIGKNISNIELKLINTLNQFDTKLKYIDLIKSKTLY